MISDSDDFMTDEESLAEFSFNAPGSITDSDIGELKCLNKEIIISSWTSNSINFSLPTSLLPRSLVESFGFSCSNILLNVNIVLKLGWISNPSTYILSHPIYDLRYIGYPLINDFKKKFFDPSYLTSNKSCKLVQFVEQVIELLKKLQDHCCVCGSPLEFPGIKPICCSKQACEYSFYEVGVGSSVKYLIEKDPIVADFLISCYFTSENTDCNNPIPPPHFKSHSASLKSQLPAVSDLLKCKNDKEISRFLGSDNFYFLRWILLSNRAHFITLPDKFKLSQFSQFTQLMTLTSTPEAEKEFQKRKQQYGSIFLWHGTATHRLYTIQREGLKNMSGSKHQVNGAAYGPGIYLSPVFSTSIGYSRGCQNGYPKSQFPNFRAIFLCEVAQVPELLKKASSVTTLQDNQAIIVRFLFLIPSNFNNFEYNLERNPITKIPTLQDIMKH